MTNRTFTIIKPNAVAAGNSGKIIDAIIEGGFRVIALKMTYLSRNDAEKFYETHKGKPFFDELVNFMTSGPVIAGVLEKDNAVAAFRALIGNTDPSKAEEGTIRRRFAESMTKNAIHASDSDENARVEWNQFFCEKEIVIADYKG